MKGRPYTPEQMDATRPGTDSRDARFDGLHAEAKAALGYPANTLRAIRDRYREAYLDELGRWQALRDELDARERRPRTRAQATGEAASADGHDGPIDFAAEAAEAGAEDASLRALRMEVDTLTADLGRHQSELSKLELAGRSMENSWLFLERNDASLITGEALPSLTTDVQMRIVEAQEAERSRLAQEIHDGPAQALSNAIFQVEYIERVIDQDVRMARSELRFLRELLRRELGDVRAFISQLRPPLLVQLGLEGSIVDTAGTMAALTGTPIETDLAVGGEHLDEAAQTVVLRVVQEALQNVRKHAAASHVRVSSRLDGSDWVIEIRDDGRGFDVDAVAARGRRNFGLQFMRERAELIGARFEVRSRPDGGTIVWLAIPVGEGR
ncbi:MAG TPA: sensor histidine kinase [Candidatus Limnocylindrales bacterium]